MAKSAISTSYASPSQLLESDAEILISGQLFEDSEEWITSWGNMTYQPDVYLSYILFAFLEMFSDLQQAAERLKQSQDTAASLTTFKEVDMSGIMEFTKRYKDEILKKTYSELIVSCSAVRPGSKWDTELLHSFENISSFLQVFICHLEPKCCLKIPTVNEGSAKCLVLIVSSFVHRWESTAYFGFFRYEISSR